MRDSRAPHDRQGHGSPPDGPRAGLTPADYAELWHLARRLQECTSLPDAEAAAAAARADCRSPAVARAIEATVCPALDFIHERDRLRTLATLDPLTGLANRRVMEDALAYHFEQATRLGRPLAVALFDLDRFRDSNRRHGHLAGDQLLRVFATLLEAAGRGRELACRYGGDEFVLIMPAATAAGALARLEPVMRRLAAAIAPDSRLPDPVTVSVGIAQSPADGTDPAALLAAADLAMYRAKQAGGNRICLASATRLAAAPAHESRP